MYPPLPKATGVSPGSFTVASNLHLHYGGSMRTPVTASLAGIVLLLGLGGAYYLLSVAPVAPDKGRLTVGATIFPLADITRAIGGEHAQVILLIPPGVTEHSQALQPQQLQALQSARAVFRIGHRLDDRLIGSITKAVPGIRSIPVDRGIALRQFGPTEHAPAAAPPPHSDNGVDPHYWLTVPNATTIAATITDRLVELDPAHASDFRANLSRYQATLAQLEGELQTMARTVPRPEFIAMHNAWSYFADQYGLVLVATYEPVEGSEPSLADLERLRAIIAQHGLTTFFAEPQKASSAATSFLKREFGLRILTLDPVGGSAGNDSYIALMRANMAALIAGSR